MKHLFLTLMIIFIVDTLVGCSKPEYRIDELEEATKKQEEEIRQLQSKISQQQEEIKQLKAKQPSQQEDDPIARALRMKWGGCGKVDVSGEVVRIFHCNIHAVASFIDSGPETYARRDLNYFLEETGLKTGIVEYYTNKGLKIFSISGSLYSAETESYY